MSEILDEYKEENQENSRKNLTFIRLMGVLVLVVLFGIYVGDMLFGKSSLDVLLNLQMDKEDLQKKVLHLKAENAKLQKDYLELYQLDSESQ